MPRNVASGPPGASSGPVKPLTSTITTQTDPPPKPAVVDEGVQVVPAVVATPPPPPTGEAAAKLVIKRPQWVQVDLPCEECEYRESLEYFDVATETEETAVAAAATSTTTRPQTPAVIADGKFSPINRAPTPSSAASLPLRQRPASGTGDPGAVRDAATSPVDWAGSVLIPNIVATGLTASFSWSRRQSFQPGFEGLLGTGSDGGGLSRRPSSLPSDSRRPSALPGTVSPPLDTTRPPTGAQKPAANANGSLTIDFSGSTPPLPGVPGSPEAKRQKSPTLNDGGAVGASQALAAAQELRELMDRVETAVREDLVAPWRKRLGAQLSFPLTFQASRQPLDDAVPTAAADLTASASPAEANLLASAKKGAASHRESAGRNRAAASTASVVSVGIQCNLQLALERVRPSSREATSISNPAGPPPPVGHDSIATSAAAAASSSSAEGGPTVMLGEDPNHKNPSSSALAHAAAITSQRLVALMETLGPVTQSITDGRLLNSVQTRLAAVLDALALFGQYVEQHHQSDTGGGSSKRYSKLEAVEGLTVTPRKNNSQQQHILLQGGLHNSSTSRQPGWMSASSQQPDEFFEVVNARRPGSVLPLQPPAGGSKAMGHAVPMSAAEDILRRTQSPPHPAFHHTLSADLARLRTNNALLGQQPTPGSKQLLAIRGHTQPLTPPPKTKKLPPA